MPIEKLDAFQQYGLPGLVIGALFCLIIFLVREHRAERKEWIEAYRSGMCMADERQSETNAVIRELVAAVRDSRK